MKVLLAEDEALSRHLLRTFLEGWGYQVTVAPDGAEAWRAFQEGDFPIVLTDWLMPHMDGPELIRRIRALPDRTYVYVIVLTAKTEKKDLVEGLDAGADEFMSKPPHPDELRVRLRVGERIIQLERTLAAQNRELRDAQAALVQAEKLAGLGRLAAGVAHEINNPISYVSNNLSVLRRDMLAALAVLDAYRRGRTALANVEPALAAEAARLEEEMDIDWFRENLARTCDTSLEGLRRVRDIVRNLRDFARLDEAEFKEVDLNAALASALEVLCHESSSKNVQMRTHFEPLPPVPCHPGKMNQVFLNLLLNAIQACSADGTVTARTRCEADSQIVIEIEDNGCGIRPEHLSRLFEPFFTTRPIGQGTGLGLSVSFGIVRDHGGTIEVETAVERGSTFRIRLPLQR